MQTDREFAKLVAEMREAQRNYFKHGDNRMLEHAKRLEKRVDAAVKAALAPPGLFDGEE